MLWEGETGAVTFSNIFTRFKSFLPNDKSFFISIFISFDSSFLNGYNTLVLFPFRELAYFLYSRSFLFVLGGDVNYFARLCFARYVSFNTLRLLSNGLCSSSMTLCFFAWRSSVIAFIQRRSSSVGLSFSYSESDYSSLILSFLSKDSWTRVLFVNLDLGETRSLFDLGDRDCGCISFSVSFLDVWRTKRLRGKDGTTLGRCDKNLLLESFKYCLPF